MSSSYSPKDLPKLLGLLALHVLLARLTVFLFGSDDVVGFLWLVSGVALALVLMDGYKALPVAFLGAMLGYWAIDTSFGASLLFALRHVALIFGVVWLLKREGRFDPALRTLPDFLRILALAFGFGLVTAVFMTLAGWLSPALGGTHNFNQRWAGYTVGIIIVMPLVLVWQRLPREWAVPRVAAEAALILGLSFLGGQVVFLNWFQDFLGPIDRGYWMFLFVAWAAVRLGLHATVLILAVTAIQGIIGAQLGKGFFSNDIADTQLANYFFFMLSLSIVGMALATYVSGRKQAEAELVAMKKELESTLDAIPDLLFEVDLDGRIHGYHAHRADLLAAPPEVFMGRLFSEVLPPDAAGVCLASLGEAAEKGWSSGAQFALQLAQGESWFELSVTSKPLAEGHEKRFLVLSRDVSERKHIEVRLSEYANELERMARFALQAQETERRRLAIELHDELGQTLTAIKINLQGQERFTGQTPGELNAENIGMVEAALQQVRRLAQGLRPAMLDDLGLVPALRWLAGQTEARADLVVAFHAGAFAARLAPEIETACFRIAQEALTNIQRHANALQVEIELSRDSDTLLLRVRDDGCGFDPAAMRRRALEGGSLGVLGMQERAMLIGGQLDILSAHGQGSSVRLRAPLRLRAEAL